jgi:hypothetical protein
MPEYLYLCETNNKEFDAEHSIKTELEECMICAELGMPNHKPKRLIAGRTSARVELGEQEYRAKIKADTAEYKRDFYKSEDKIANMVGEERYHKNQIEFGKNRR